MNDDFFEDDEPVDYVVAAFNSGEKVVTAPPAGQTVNLAPDWLRRLDRTARLDDTKSNRDHLDEIETLRQDLDAAAKRYENLLAQCHRNTEQIGSLQRDNAKLANERDALRNEVRHVVQLYRRGNLMGTVVGVDRLGELLDGGT